MKRRISYSIISILILALILSACTTAENGRRIASGTLSALQVAVVPEVSGKAVEVNAQEGQSVLKGDVLLKLDDAYLLAQRDQAQAGVDATQATLEAAQAQLEYARAQRNLALDGARFDGMTSRQSAWSVPVPDDYQASWYFQKGDQLKAAQSVVDAALKTLDSRKAALEYVLNDSGNADFVQIEQDLAVAQTRLSVAKATLAQAESNKDKVLIEAAQSTEDLAQSQFDTALRQYKDALTTSSADSVREARAQVATAQADYDNARDTLLSYQSDEESGQVAVAEAGVKQAEAALPQAEANLAQAQAALALLELQLERAQVTAPMEGRVMVRNVEVGEMAMAGGTVMTIAQLDPLELVVYVSETWYGQITLGDEVSIKVDSFPNETFKGKVLKIADQAEFTPRNVQTTEGRTTTVFAIRVEVPNAAGRLKPGMPTDVDFGK